jgi:hypothetical protein
LNKMTVQELRAELERLMNWLGLNAFLAEFAVISVESTVLGV